MRQEAGQATPPPAGLVLLSPHFLPRGPDEMVCLRQRVLLEACVERVMMEGSCLLAAEGGSSALPSQGCTGCGFTAPAAFLLPTRCWPQPHSEQIQAWNQ